MAKYDKSGIMTQAWTLFNSDNFDTCDYEYTTALVYGQKTFSDCLKEAWGREKAIVDEMAEKEANAPFSEEAKAWDWACRKLGVTADVTAVEKVRYVDEMAKEMWSANVWKQAIKAVQLYVSIAA
ncbi:hypothetical protein BOVMAS36_14620 [Streptococcus uberis]